MVERPSRGCVTAYLCELDQWEALNLLSPRNDDATRIGSGGYGHRTPNASARPQTRVARATAADRSQSLGLPPTGPADLPAPSRQEHWIAPQRLLARTDGG